MKKFLLTALAATVATAPIAATAAEAAPARHTSVDRYYGNGRSVHVERTVRPGYGYNQGRYHKWNRGQRFDRRYAQNYRVVDYRQYRGRHLYAPPRGYQWVQSGNDAVLVAIASGLIGAVLGGALR